MKPVLPICALILAVGVSKAPCQQPRPAANTVSFTVSKQRKMLIEARMNGEAGIFMVDTGAGDTYVDERFAEGLHAPVTEGGYTYNVLGPMRFGVVAVDSVELGRGRVPVGHGLIHVSNLGWVNNAGRAGGVHGIIGADILIHNQAVIDCAQDQIRFGYAGGRNAAAPGLRVNFIPRRGDELAVAARINGMPGIFIVDTGYNVSLLSPEFLYKFNANGSKLRTFGITSMELGAGRVPVRHDQMVVTTRVDVANQGYMQLGEAPYDGVLGMDFLMNHHAVIDCAQRQLHVE